MIWLSWRQFRVQAFVAAAALVGIAAYLLVLGGQIREARDIYDSGCASPGGCAQALSQFHAAFQNKLLVLDTALGLVSAVIGAFWGAPLVARELEAGTHRLVWSQSVGRRAWLLHKVAFVGLAAVVFTAAVSLLLTWVAAPYDEVAGDRFGALEFGARYLVPVGYACLAFALGTLLGLLMRRTLPAMALTGALFIAVQFAFPNLVRPHLIPPEQATLELSADGINQARSLGSITGDPVIGGIRLVEAPDAWISDVSPLLTADGTPLSGSQFNACLDNPPKRDAGGTFGDTAACLGELDLHVEVEYQPARRYWSFQLIETGVYLGVSGLFVLAAVRCIRRT